MPAPGLLRPGCMARNLGSRWRRLDEPSQPPHRPSRVDDGRGRVGVRKDGDRARSHRERGYRGRHAQI